MKLFVALVTSAVVMVPGVALAQEAPAPPAEAVDAATSGGHVARTAACPVAGSAAAKAPAQAAPAQAGVAEQCRGYSQELADPKLYLCAVTGAVQQGLTDNGGGALAGPVGTVRSTAGLTGCDGGGACSTNCTPKTTPPGGGGGGTPPLPEVLSAADDGSLPRTGGAGSLPVMGFALAALGSLVRRFVPGLPG